MGQDWQERSQSRNLDIDAGFSLVELMAGQFFSSLHHCQSKRQISIAMDNVQPAIRSLSHTVFFLKQSDDF